MKSFTFWFRVAMASGLVGGSFAADLPPQPQISFTAGSAGTWNADWMGAGIGVNRTYFVQWSLNLVTWHYAPVVEFGTGSKHYGINTSNAPKFFVRLKYSDVRPVTTLQQARDADFDGDGIPNAYEVENLGSDPLDRNSAGGDSDLDGLVDGWEQFYFGGLGVAGGAAIGFPLPSGDGLTHKEKSELGLNPNTDYSAPTATQPTNYTYDGADRLIGVTDPVAAATYSPDAEGNLLNAQ